jgi:hypothetical protein
MRRPSDPAHRGRAMPVLRGSPGCAVPVSLQAQAGVPKLLTFRSVRDLQSPFTRERGRQDQPHGQSAAAPVPSLGCCGRGSEGESHRAARRPSTAAPGTSEGGQVGACHSGTCWAVPSAQRIPSHLRRRTPQASCHLWLYATPRILLQRKSCTGQGGVREEGGQR